MRERQNIMTIFSTFLPHRSVVRISGSDRRAFLQGLISNDVGQTAFYAALLTPQGKFLHDLFVLDFEDACWADCEAARIEDLLQRLTAYKLRSKVTFENLGEAFAVGAVWGGAYEAMRSFADPRLPELGMRVFVEKGKSLDAAPAPFEDYDRHRLQLGVGDGSRDMEVGKATLVEGNFDFLNGVDWKKGCYIGQELTARMHYRGLAKKRLFPVKIEGTSPGTGALIYRGANEAGEMRSSQGDCGLALLKIEAVEAALAQKEPLICGETRLWPSIPAWMKIDAANANR